MHKIRNQFPKKMCAARVHYWTNIMIGPVFKDFVIIIAD